MPDPIPKPEKVPYEWLAHKTTLRLRLYLEQQHAMALNALFYAAAASPDPKVRECIRAVTMFGDFADLVKLDNGSEEADESDDSDGLGGGPGYDGG